MSWLYPKRLVGVLLVATLLPGVADANGSNSGGHGQSSASRSGTHANSGHSSGRAKATGVLRDSQLRLGKGLRYP